MNELLIGLFALIGGSARYGIDQLLGSPTFPWVTLLINLTGSFLLAWISSTLGQFAHIPGSLTLGLGTGMIGAYTTFSTFTLELWHLWQHGQWVLVGGYALGSLILGPICALAGIYASHWFVKRAQQKGQVLQ